jgi:hypothetical protein
MTAIKQALVDLAENLPDDCTWDDVMHCLYVRQKIDAGIKEADESQFLSHDEVFKEWCE